MKYCLLDIKRRLAIKNNLILGGKYLHLRCACHILNLVVKDGLRELVESIEGIRNCVKFIHSSPARLDKFRDFAIMEKFDPMSTVPMDVSTRWNSTYSMLESAFKYRNVFSRMIEYECSFVAYFEEMEKVKKRKRAVDESVMVKRLGPPSDYDWKQSQAFTHFLKKFYDTTVKLSATKTTTSDIVFKEVFSIQREIIAKTKDGSDPVLQHVAISMLAKFDKYWGSYEKVNKLIFVANILDPRYKFKKIPISFKGVGASAAEIEAIVLNIKSCLYDLYLYYREEDDDVSSSTYQVNDVHGQNDNALDYDDMDDLQITQELMGATFESTHEVDRYFTDPHVPLFDPHVPLFNPKFKLLDWWKDNQPRYPTLSKIAKIILAIPSSTVASESAFSLGKRVVDPFRSSLTPKTVEALVCCSDWLRAEEFNFYKDPTEDELELYKELEQIETNSFTTQHYAS